MQHQACLNALKRKRASNIIASFLSGRQMTIKVGQTYSRKQTINGGSPQGCVLANLLFCATIEDLQTADYKLPDAPLVRALLQDGISLESLDDYL